MQAPRRLGGSMNAAGIDLLSYKLQQNLKSVFVSRLYLPADCTLDASLTKVINMCAFKSYLRKSKDIMLSFLTLVKVKVSHTYLIITFA